VRTRVPEEDRFSVTGETRPDSSVFDEDTYVEEVGQDWAPAGPGRRVRVTALVLSLLGLADSTYLTISHFQNSLLSSTCAANSVVNCIKVTTSPESVVFGIPVAILGLCFYVAMTLVNLPPLWKTTDARVAWLRLAMAVTGIGFVLYLIYAELFEIKAICEYCTGVHVVTFGLFLLIVLTFPSMLHRQAGGWHDDGGGDDWDEDISEETESLAP
jgi:uncharacterized membrane protein